MSDHDVETTRPLTTRSARPRRAGRGLGAAFLALAILLCAAPAIHAQERYDEALEAYRAGVTAYDAGDFTTAARLLRQAYALDPNPRLAFNAARAYELDGQHELALEFFQLALQTSDSGEFQAVAREAIERVRNLQRAPRTAGPRGTAAQGAPAPHPDGALFIVPDRGLRAILGDNPPDETPLSRVLPPGTHRVEILTADGAVRRYELTATPGTVILIRPLHARRSP